MPAKEVEDEEDAGVAHNKHLHAMFTYLGCLKSKRQTYAPKQNTLDHQHRKGQTATQRRAKKPASTHNRKARKGAGGCAGAESNKRKPYNETFNAKKHRDKRRGREDVGGQAA